MMNLVCKLNSPNRKCHSLLNCTGKCFPRILQLKGIMKIITFEIVEA